MQPSVRKKDPGTNIALSQVWALNKEGSVKNTVHCAWVSPPVAFRAKKSIDIMQGVLISLEVKRTCDNASSK
jgi:hypothetical protein